MLAVPIAGIREAAQMDLDIRSVLQFAAVAEELSFTRAASRLRVAQPWLSTRIRQLERQLGVPLFVRSTRRVELTEEGHALFEKAQPVAGAMRADTARALRQGGTDRLRIGTLPYGSQIRLRVALVERFAARWPQTGVELDVGWTPALLERVRRGSLDLAFVVGEVEEADFEALTIDETRLQLLVERDDALAGQRSVPLAALRGRRVAVFARGLNPVLFDRLFAPFEAAGAKLVQRPDPLEVPKDSRSRTPGAVVVVFGWNAQYAARKSGRLRRGVAGSRAPIALQVVRNRGVRTRAAENFWRLAQESLREGKKSG
jgi:DNA-binding transcriptional LysR family regulator